MTFPEVDPALDKAVQAILSVARALEVNGHDATRRVDGPEAALGALTVVEKKLAVSPGRPQDTSLLLEVRAARAEILAYELARQRSMLPLLTEGLGRLRAAETVDDLVELIPIHAAQLGYERALFSWVDHEHWVPRAIHTRSGPEEAREIMLAGAPPYRHVRDLVEVEVVRNRRAILVLDATTNPRIHPRIAPVSRSHTYVAAPIIARNHVAAFVHVDLNVETGTTDEFDRDLLTFFCESIGAMLDRLIGSGLTMAKTTPHAPIADWLEALTNREREVLRLVAAGHTNAQIGARLFISEETIKTHVKKLMRKMGVRNRAEAGALFHRHQAWAQSSPAPASSPPQRRDDPSCGHAV